MTTMVMVSWGPRGRAGGGSWPKECWGTSAGFVYGLKFSATTALGITDTIRGSSDALSTVFSLLAQESAQGSPRLSSRYVRGLTMCGSRK